MKDRARIIELLDEISQWELHTGEIAGQCKPLIELRALVDPTRGNEVLAALSKIQDSISGLRHIEYRLADEQEAVRLFNAVMDFFDKEVIFGSDGAALPEHADKNALANSITDWLSRGRR